MNKDQLPGSDAMEIKVAELLVATADESDQQVDQSVSQVLKLLRERMQMDVVFVSEFTNGRRVFRHVEQAANHRLISPGDSHALEESWCQQVVDGRLPGLVRDVAPLIEKGQLRKPPFPIGTHLSTPIVLESGEVYGTLCCFSFGVNPAINQQDLKKLQYTAQLTAQKIGRSRRRATHLALEPMEQPVKRRA